MELTASLSQGEQIGLWNGVLGEAVLLLIHAHVRSTYDLWRHANNMAAEDVVIDLIA